MTITEIILLSGAIATACYAVWKIVSSIFNNIRDKYHLFLDVLESYTGRSGNKYREAEPSVPERMKTNEGLLQKLVEQSEINEIRLYKIEKMVYQNGGDSLLDLVQDLTKEVSRISKDHNSHKETP